MKILGLAAPFGHDASAALIVDGKIVAAVEEERFTCKKHASDQLPIHAVKFCLKTAQIKPEEIDYIAYPWSLKILQEKRWEYLKRTFFTNPSRAYKNFFRNNKEYRGQLDFISQTLMACGFDISDTKIEWVVRKWYIYSNQIKSALLAELFL